MTGSPGWPSGRWQRGTVNHRAEPLYSTLLSPVSLGSAPDRSLRRSVASPRSTAGGRGNGYPRARLLSAVPVQ